MVIYGHLLQRAASEGDAEVRARLRQHINKIDWRALKFERRDLEREVELLKAELDVLSKRRMARPTMGSTPGPAPEELEVMEDLSAWRNGTCAANARTPRQPSVGRYRNITKSSTWIRIENPR